MSVKLLQIDGGLVTPKDDAILYQYILQSAGVIEGCAVTSLGANQLQVAAGRLMIMGRQVIIEQETILAALSTSGTVNGRLLIHIDLTNSTTPIQFITQAAATLQTLTRSDINHGGAVYEYPMATYQVDQTQITGLTAATNPLATPATLQLACTKSGTVYALTGLTAMAGAVQVTFKAPTAYVVGDTVTIDGTAYALKTTDATALTPAAWATGAIVTGTVDVDAKTLTVNPSAPVGAQQGIAILADVDCHTLTVCRDYIIINTDRSAAGNAALHYPAVDGCFSLSVWPTLNVAGGNGVIWTARNRDGGGTWECREVNGGYSDWTKVGDGGHAASADYASGTIALTSAGLRNNTISSATPSGGSEGDTWDQV